MDDLERYLDEVVEPTIKDFEANPTSVRHAFLACVATFHGVDYLAHPRKPQQLRQEFRRRSPDFELIDHVAHAFKHVTTGNPVNPQLTATGVIMRPPGKFGELVLDLSRLDDPVGGVTLDNDRTIGLLEIVRRAAAFLRGRLHGC